MTATTPLDLGSLGRTMDDVVTMAELREKLGSGRPMRIKYGVDVTAPFLHIGHAVNLWAMRDLQERGHVVVFLVGDFTTRIGDPTGRSETRKVIDRDDIERNAERFIEQVGRVLLTDPAVFEVRRNSEWWDAMSIDELLGLLAMVTHSRLIQRDMFQQRIAAGHEIHVHELLYPILQGYDSYALASDLTIVGTDQLFNELMGRFFQERLGQAPQVVATTRITPGTDGREKQSKSLGNYVAIADPPREMFGKLMSIPDGLIRQYLEVYTVVPLDEVAAMAGEMAAGRLNPRDAKRALARAVVERYHGAEAAGAEDEWFMSTFSQRRTPDDVEVVTVPAGTTVLDALARCLPGETRSALRRLVGEGAVRLGGRKLVDPHEVLVVDGDDVLQVGKRRWFRIEAS